MIRALFVLLLPIAAQADTLRVATFNTELSRDGPGILLRDIRRGDPQVDAVVQVLTAVQPDVVALQGIDWDYDGLALTALAESLREAGLDYPNQYAAQPNSGLATDLDLDGDGKTHGPGDSQGWGRFTGHNGIAVLSRYPIIDETVVSYSEILWRDVPGATLPETEGIPFPSAPAQATQRLSSSAHWLVPIQSPLGRINLMTFHASPPVFDGPEDRNGLRNADEIRLWSQVLSGAMGPKPAGPFVIAGDANLDPEEGDGRKEAILDLLSNPAIQDAQPKDPSGTLATVEWKGVGAMRVDYVLPSADWQVVDAGVFWPDADSDERTIAEAASRHRLVWVDLAFD